MEFIEWTGFGALAGVIVSVFMEKGHSLLFNTAMGITGAISGGIIFNALGAPNVSGINWNSLVLIIVGAIGAIRAGKVIHRF